MGIKRFKMPDPGEGLVEAEIITWKVKPGDDVKVNDIVVEIETAKSLVELPIPWAGTVSELLVPEGKTVDVGTEIITVDVPGEQDDPADGGDAMHATEALPISGGEAAPAEHREPNLVGYGAVSGTTQRRARKKAAPAAASAPAAPAPVAPPAPEPVVAPEPVAPPAQRAEEPVARDGRPLAKPPVRKMAKDMGINLAEVNGSGPDGIITREDVTAHASGGSAGGGVTPAAPAVAAFATPAAAGERETRIPVKGVRKMTAQAMVHSKFTAPHVTEFITVDCTGMMELVERLKEDREFKNVKVTPLLILAKAVLLASRRHSGINAFWDEDAQEIVQKNYVNLGIAAATPRGLIVPNIKDADRMNLLQLAEAMGQLIATAREGKTPPSDMAGGTFTITNVGVFGVDTGTPIINPGESAIMAFGAVRRMPWVMEDEWGEEEIVPRWVTQLSMSFDHRLIDGDLGSRFLADVAAVLEDPAKGLLWG